jgi:hypothetical protein
LLECPICEKEFELRGSNSYSVHMQTKHPLYWAKARRLRQIATADLIISLSLTILLLVFFYSFNEIGYAVMGLATLFLAISAVFSLRERGLGKRYRNRDARKGKLKKLDMKERKNEHRESKR